jgi:hypothetical protein
MKLDVCCLGVLGLAVLAAAADPPAPSPAKPQLSIKAPVVITQPPAQAAPVAPKRLLGKPVTYGGVVVKVIRVDKPLQMLNPLAPAKYGDGSENLDRHPRTGQPQGVKLFSISF